MTLNFDDLDQQRRAAGPLLLALIWALVAAIGFAAFVDGGDVTRALMAGGIPAVAGTAAWLFLSNAKLARVLVGTLFMAQISVLVAFGGAWQVNLHMAYFAALALLMVFGDEVVILASAATVGVHHLVLSYVLPTAVFSGSQELGLVMLHAVVLAVEAGALIWVLANLGRMFALSHRSLTAAEEAARSAAAAAAAAEAAGVAERAARDLAGQTLVETQARERALVATSIGTAIGFLTRGDLTHRIAGELPGEYDSMQAEFNSALNGLNATIGEVMTISTDLVSNIDEISTGTGDLAQRTEQQAASLEETAAALDGITTTVRKTSQGAAHAREIVGHAKAEVDRSGQVVREAVDAMGGIERSSSQIGQIIGVIDEIAFQTNLLALNAGVEAARAGEAGRGFAVVASEVRALAQRSAESAKEIKSLISASASQVERGVTLVQETGRALERIVGEVDKVNDIVSEIAASSQEQATELLQVNAAVNRMDEVTQRNAGMVKQTTAASRVLKQKTSELSVLMRRFSIGEGASSATASPDPATGAKRAAVASRPRIAWTADAARRPALAGSIASPSNDWHEF